MSLIEIRSSFFFFSCFSFVLRPVDLKETEGYILLIWQDSFSCAAKATLFGEFRWYAPWFFKWDISVARPELWRVCVSLTHLFDILNIELIFPCTSSALLCGEFLLHAPCSFVLGRFLTRTLLFLCREFLFFPHPVLLYVGTFFYMPHPTNVEYASEGCSQANTSPYSDK